MKVLLFLRAIDKIINKIKNKREAKSTRINKRSLMI